MSERPFDLAGRLRDVIEQMKVDHFGKRDGPVVTLSDDARVEESGRVRGCLEVRIAKRSGEMALLQSARLDDVSDEQGMRDLLADILSKILANHNAWPR